MFNVKYEQRLCQFSNINGLALDMAFKVQRKHLVWAVLAAALFVALVWARVYQLQRAHFNAAEGYLAKGDYKLALREYDTAMHFYTPFSSIIDRAALRLWEMGGEYERNGKYDLAVIAYSSIRSSFYAARSFYTPGREWIRKCDEKIAELNVSMMVIDGLVKAEDSEREYNKHLSVLRTDSAPKVGWSLGAEAGFLGWVSAVVFIIFKGFDSKGRLRRRNALYGAAFFLLAFSVWAVSLLKA